MAKEPTPCPPGTFKPEPPPAPPRKLNELHIHLRKAADEDVPEGTGPTTSATLTPQLLDHIATLQSVVDAAIILRSYEVIRHDGSKADAAIEAFDAALAKITPATEEAEDGQRS